MTAGGSEYGMKLGFQRIVCLEFASTLMYGLRMSTIKMHLSAMLLAMSILPSLGQASSEELASLVDVELMNGQILSGKIFQESDEEVQLELSTGDVITLRRSSIKAILHDDPKMNDPSVSRYFFSPSAFMLKAGS
jgi:hypothetical protein